ncbi:iron-containing alcohol dehydrogenase [Phyllobacterium zundukense]|uniref:Alcohol dehydrogenase 2 n=1 Tax=Phyllobacterium zundukense TaxID=1867719 RepID=A0A2N9W0N5_9HYPH|nr:iron-containing alcohol dehydrogenase [Phyllobacterium zundukense]ATU95451.1 alcohol dehydrogenase [Phyllobacterium zundukense]PIO45303.1 alcohol dehydrogenase [Phyllobacterium zundukense]
MKSFQFDTVNSIQFEWGAARRLGDILGAIRPERQLLLVTDKILRQLGTLDQAVASLQQSGFTVTIFDEVVADPPEQILMRCAAIARQSGIDIVVGLGGGSSLDIAKLAALLARSDQPLCELYGIGNVRGERLALVQIPTTAGTGSEVTNISILTTGETTKMGVVSKQLYADLVILDGELTLGLPRSHTAATGIDAMVHAIEAFTSRHKKNPVSDALAREALHLLSSHIETACNDGQNREAREAMLLGSMLAGQAFANAPVAAVHALAYPLGGHYHIPHGLSNALMLGPVLRFNMKVAAPLYAELADVLALDPSGETEHRALRFVTYLEGLMDRTGAPRRLRDVKVERRDLGMLASEAMKQQRLLVNNPAEVDQAAALKIYEAAF